MKNLRTESSSSTPGVLQTRTKIEKTSRNSATITGTILNIRTL